VPCGGDQVKPAAALKAMGRTLKAAHEEAPEEWFPLRTHLQAGLHLEHDLDAMVVLVLKISNLHLAHRLEAPGDPDRSTVLIFPRYFRCALA
jgi:hypothetical protein